MAFECVQVMALDIIGSMKPAWCTRSNLTFATAPWSAIKGSQYI